jgi:lysophospholipase L1-like esterase
MPVQAWEVPASDYKVRFAPRGGRRRTRAAATLRKRIVTAGDSTTRRDTSQQPTWHNWPDFDFRTKLGQYAQVINEGDAGATVADAIAKYSLVTRWAPHTITVLIGINTVRTQVTPDAAALQAELTTLYTKYRQFCAKLVPITITPFSDGTWSAARETVRQTVNAWIMGGAGLGLTAVNIEPAIADNTDPAHPVIASAYSAGDGLHLSAAGGLAVAQEVFAQGFGGVPVPRW